MSLSVHVDPEYCQGHGRCFDACPEIFVPDVEGYATVSQGQPVPTHLENAARRAAMACPEHAITADES